MRFADQTLHLRRDALADIGSYHTLYKKRLPVAQPGH